MPSPIMYLTRISLYSLLTTLTAVAAFAPMTAHAQKCDHRILFLPQMHNFPVDQFNINGIAENEVVASQLKIANFIDHSPPHEVFAENADPMEISIANIGELLNI